MDKIAFAQKIDYMLPELIDCIKKDTLRLFDSGAVDTESYGNDFALPKIILTVSLENQAYQYMPFSPDYKKAVKNLRKFQEI